MTPLSVAIIGAGPAGFYTAEALLDAIEAVRIDIVDRLPTPFGLVRAGVAPDHQSTKQVARRFEQTALREAVHFFGNVEIGSAVSLDELRTIYDAVVLALGAGQDRVLGIPGEHLLGVYGSALFVGWYNGHPDLRELNPRMRGPAAVVIGNGNVALDVARVLVKSPEEMAASDLPDYAGQAIAEAGIREVHIVGRRGPADVKFTPAELREMGELRECDPVIDLRDFPESIDGGDPRDRRVKEKNLAILRAFAQRSPGKPKRLMFRFFLSPDRIEGDTEVQAVRFARTRLQGGSAVPTGDFETLPCGLVVEAIGYRCAPLTGAAFDAERGLFPSQDGRIDDGLYAVGWAKRGPVGVIGSNRPDAELCARQIREDFARGTAGKPGRAAFERLLRERRVRSVSFDDWLAIDAAEVAGAVRPAPRKKFTTLAEMLAVLAEARARPASPEPLAASDAQRR